MKKVMTNEYYDRVQHWLRTLRADFYQPLGDIPLEGFATFERLAPADAARAACQPMTPGQHWGETWQYLWLRGRVTLPPAAAGKQIVLDLNPGGEASVFVNGAAFGTRRAEWVAVPHHYMADNFITLSGEEGQAFDILMEAYAGHFYPGTGSVSTGPVLPGAYRDDKAEGRRAVLGQSTYGVWNEDAYQLYMDAATLLSLYQALPDNDLRTADVASALENFTHIADFEQPPEGRTHSYIAARAALRPALAVVNGSRQAQFYAVGNAHLDLAWLWPMDETIRKTARTFAQQLRLLERYPDYIFIQSQPASYEMCKAAYPELYERVKAAVREGRWIADGAMYVEPDTNMASGEALIRQLVYGKRFFREEFGLDSEVLWLPDTFGYTAALPQILRGCGVKYLVTQKIFWTYNDCDPFPYHYFNWVGMDGSRVISFLPTSYTYPTDPETLVGVWNERRQKRGLDSFLIPFGYGDGGGGPCRDHIEYVRRQADLQGAPKVKCASPAAFFADMEAKGAPTDTWDGELYFSAHRGTYTTQAAIKRNNRRSEIALREMELWSTLAQKLTSFHIDAAQFDILWKALLLHQFHDILPGSSIERVYAEANAAHAKLQADCRAITGRALAAIAGDMHKYTGVTFFNGLSWPRRAVVTLDSRFDGGAATPEGDAVAVVDGRAVVSVPAMGWVSLLPSAAPPAPPVCRAEITPSGFVLKNDCVTARFNTLGEMTRYENAADGIVYAGRSMNKLRLFKDVPRKFDAWDIDSVYERDEILLTGGAVCRVIEVGGLTCAVAVDREFADFSISQTIRLTAGDTGVAFETTVDWRALHRLLKVRFDGGVRAREALHEMQFGYVTRPTHRSNAYDQARFEVCNHRYTALCDAGRGFALLNDGKYGVGTGDGCIDLTLLRAAAAPHMRSDQGLHKFTYVFTAWTGDFAASGVWRQAAELNQPLLRADGCAAAFSAFQVNRVGAGDSNNVGSCTGVSDCSGGSGFPGAVDCSGISDCPGVVLETVKPAQDGSGDVILRLYEAVNASARCVLSAALPFARAWTCDMLENRVSELPAVNGRISLDFRPFEVKTVRFGGTGEIGG